MIDAASHSFWTTFACPRRGYLHHILGLRSPFKSRYLLRGAAVHVALAFFYTSKEISSHLVVECFEQNLEASLALYENRTHYHEDREWGRDLLTAYCKRYRSDFNAMRIIHVEKDISRELAPGIWIHGILDLVVEASTLTLIIDHKTSSKGFSQAFEDFLIADQGPTYQYLYPEANGVLPNILYKNRGKVDFGRPSIIVYSPEELENWRTSTLATIYDISQRAIALQEDPEMSPFAIFPRNAELCRFCTYKLVCRKSLSKTNVPDGFNIVEPDLTPNKVTSKEPK